MMIKPDSRLWVPDETCIPFVLETIVDPTTNRRLIDFTVKPHTIAVITELYCNTFGAAASKDSARITIAKTVSASGLDEGSIYLHGALANVKEHGITPTDNFSGFIFAAGITRKVRLFLEPADYYLMQIGSGAASALFIGLNGYSFYDNERRGA